MANVKYYMTKAALVAERSGLNNRLLNATSAKGIIKAVAVTAVVIAVKVIVMEGEI